MSPTRSVERIQLARKLFTAAGEFADESTRHIGTAAQLECQRIAGVLSTISRALLENQADQERSKAFLEASEIILAKISAQRRLIEAIFKEWRRP